MAFELGDNQKVTLSPVGRDEVGNVGPTPPGPYAWSVSDPGVLNVDSVSEDTLSAVVSAMGPLGSATVTVASSEIVGVGEIQVIATTVVSLGLLPGTPEHK